MFKNTHKVLLFASFEIHKMNSLREQTLLTGKIANL
jgi:hypothetical protein